MVNPNIQIVDVNSVAEKSSISYNTAWIQMILQSLLYVLVSEKLIRSVAFAHYRDSPDMYTKLSFALFLVMLVVYYFASKLTLKLSKKMNIPNYTLEFTTFKLITVTLLTSLIMYIVKRVFNISG